jgi:hypothetical protein
VRHRGKTARTDERECKRAAEGFIVYSSPPSHAPLYGPWKELLAVSFVALCRYVLEGVLSQRRNAVTRLYSVRLCLLTMCWRLRLVKQPNCATMTVSQCAYAEIRAVTSAFLLVGIFAYHLDTSYIEFFGKSFVSVTAPPVL